MICKANGERALVDKLHRLIGARRGVLAQITGKRREVEDMKSDNSNLKKVQECMHKDFSNLVNEFKELHKQVGDLLPEDEKAVDLSNWFEPKMLVIRQFEEETEKWMDAMSESKTGEENKDEYDYIGPEDSASQVSVGTCKSAQAKGSTVGRLSVMSARSSVCANEEAKLAGLIERAAALQAKQELELEEAHIKAKLEMLALGSAIAEKRAEVRVLKEYEKSEDGMNSYLQSHKISIVRVKDDVQSHSSYTDMPVSGSKFPSRPLQCTQPQVVRQRHANNTDRPQFDKNNDGIIQVMQKQNMITEIIVTKTSSASSEKCYSVQG